MKTIAECIAPIVGAILAAAAAGTFMLCASLVGFAVFGVAWLIHRGLQTPGTVTADDPAFGARALMLLGFLWGIGAGVHSVQGYVAAWHRKR
jgi:hypothetical protein